MGRCGLLLLGGLSLLRLLRLLGQCSLLLLGGLSLRRLLRLMGRCGLLLLGGLSLLRLRRRRLANCLGHICADAGHKRRPNALVSSTSTSGTSFQLVMGQQVAQGAGVRSTQPGSTM